jgi:hypothetical protein
VRSARRRVVEILYVEGCPHFEGARALVEQLAGELDLEPQIRMVSVLDLDAAARARFLGSPTVRVDGRDVERGTEDRRDFALSCRVYRTEHGLAGQPEEEWVRAALMGGGP